MVIGVKKTTSIIRRVDHGRLVTLNAAGYEELQSKQQALMMQLSSKLGVQNVLMPNLATWVKIS